MQLSAVMIHLGEFYGLGSALEVLQSPLTLSTVGKEHGYPKCILPLHSSIALADVLAETCLHRSFFFLHKIHTF